MKNTSHECSKCNSPMKKGMTIMDGNAWVAGEMKDFDKRITPKITSFINRAKTSNISSYGCTKCGYIEQFIDQS